MKEGCWIDALIQGFLVLNLYHFSISLPKTEDNIEYNQFILVMSMFKLLSLFILF